MNADAVLGADERRCAQMWFLAAELAWVEASYEDYA
jgi:hypothetical protein